MNVTERTLRIPAADGFSLGATLFHSGQAPTRPAHPPIVIVSPAAAVRRHFYAKFAHFIASRNAIVLSYDYRGIGDSRPETLRGFAAQMRDWGEKDIAGVLDWTSQHYPGHPIYVVGHSAGGFVTGLAHNNSIIQRQVNVATLSGYWGNMSFPENYRVLLFMGLILPALSKAIGYFPGRLAGRAEDLPKDVMLEWLRWCLKPDFMFADPTLRSIANFPSFRAPLLIIRVADDPWGTEIAVQHLSDRYVSAEKSYRVIDPIELNAGKIGHLGFFKQEFAQTLWIELSDWLLEPSI